MKEIVFAITPDHEDGGYVAIWDDPAGGGISTQGEDLLDLQAMIADAVEGYFFDKAKPASVRLHFVEDPTLALA